MNWQALPLTQGTRQYTTDGTILLANNTYTTEIKIHNDTIVELWMMNITLFTTNPAKNMKKWTTTHDTNKKLYTTEIQIHIHNNIIMEQKKLYDYTCNNNDKKGYWC